jgi:hypothetical protein
MQQPLAAVHNLILIRFSHYWHKISSQTGFGFGFGIQQQKKETTIKILKVLYSILHEKTLRYNTKTR